MSSSTVMSSAERAQQFFQEVLAKQRVQVCCQANVCNVLGLVDLCDWVNVLMNVNMIELQCQPAHQDLYID